MSKRNLLIFVTVCSVVILLLISFNIIVSLHGLKLEENKEVSLVSSSDSRLEIPDEQVEQPPPLSHFAIIGERNVFASGETSGSVREERTRQISENQWLVVKQDVNIARESVKTIIKELLSKPDVSLKGQFKKDSSNSRASSSSKTSKEDDPKDLADKVKQMSLDVAFNIANKSLRNVQVSPNMVGEQMSGVVAFGVTKGSIVDQMGIRNGDIIVEINGYKIKSLLDIISVYREVRNARVVTAKVVRGTETKTFTYGVVE